MDPDPARRAGSRAGSSVVREIAMSPNQLFSLVNMVALGAWLLLALGPRRHKVPQMVSGVAVPALLATVYVAIIVTQWGGSEGGFSSLQDVATLFSNPWLLLAGWTHYLAFDLLVGAWEVRDASDRGIPHVLVLPCLALTFLFGPAGWLLYLVLRTVHGALRRGRPSVPFSASTA
jgi:hypothetical protein